MPAHHLSEAEIDALRGIILARSTTGKLHFSASIEELPSHPACLPETAAWIRDRIEWYQRRGKRVEWPLSVRRAARVTQAMSAQFRGRRPATQAAPKVSRGGFWVDEQGQAHELTPHLLYESDDVSINEPFRWKDPDTGVWMAGRQTLVTVDVGSAAFMGGSLVGRSQDAYRQEDIADHFLDVCEQHGMPHVWRLEHGAWAAKFVKGIEVDGMEKRWGGLDGLFRVIHTTGPESKGLIESRFHLLQTFMAHTEGGITLGRHPGEFEQAARLMRRVTYDRRRADADSVCDQAAVQRLWPMERAADAVRAAMERANSRPVKRSWQPAQMVPVSALQASGKGVEIPETERWRFHPVKMSATVRRGQIEIKLPRYAMPFRFAINGVGDLYLEDGYQVLIAFHPGRPELGCALANRQAGVKNYKGWSLGEIIHCELPYQPLLPQVDLTTQSGTAGNGMAQRHATAIRTEYRGIRDQMEAYKSARAREIEEESMAPVADRSRRAEVRDSTGNRLEHAGTRAALPDLSRLRSAALPETEGDEEISDPMTSFRGSSLFTEEERELLRHG